MRSVVCVSNTRSRANAIARKRRLVANAPLVSRKPRLASLLVAVVARHDSRARGGPRREVGDHPTAAVDVHRGALGGRGRGSLGGGVGASLMLPSEDKEGEE